MKAGLDNQPEMEHLIDSPKSGSKESKTNKEDCHPPSQLAKKESLGYQLSYIRLLLKNQHLHNTPQRNQESH